MLGYVIFWGVLFAITAVVEAMSVQLVSIWFSLSALITMFFALTDLSFSTQLLIFFILSVVLLIATRPFVKKVISLKAVSTNYELDIGKTARVTEEINAAAMTGRVILDGVSWQAKSENGEIIPEGHAVIVKNIDSTTLVVAE